MSPDEADEVVVWRLAGALLAVPLAAVVEIAAVTADGRAVTRAGRLELRTPPGLSLAADAADCTRAVVVRTGGGAMALAAEVVEGVKPYTKRERAPTPPWIRTLPTEHLAGLIRLDDRRVAALLAVDTLPVE